MILSTSTGSADLYHCGGGVGGEHFSNVREEGADLRLEELALRVGCEASLPSGRHEGFVVGRLQVGEDAEEGPDLVVDALRVGQGGGGGTTAEKGMAR
jgi:hypothetical protein